MANINTEPLDRIIRQLGGITRIDMAMVEPALIACERVLVEGNRRKVLSGLDGKGKPMIGLKYRTGIGGKPTGRRGAKFGTTKFAAKGVGFKGIKTGDPHANGNLTTAEYKLLTGPPLAPRGERSRVITNVETAHGQDGSTFWVAKAFVDIVDKKGRYFISTHFRGLSTGRFKMPKRDLRGTDDQERQLARTIFADRIRQLISQATP